MTLGHFCSSFCAATFEYDTPKIVHIKSKKVGFLNRLIQLAIIGYIIGYVIIYKKGYQDTSPVQSAVITKVKGVALTDFANEDFTPGVTDHSMYNRIWDVADYVVPPDMNDAFFVTTNLIVTPQDMGTCNEDANEVPDATCYGPENSTCVKDKPFPTGNGVQTGNCTETSPFLSKTNYSCEIKAWCPVEIDVEPLGKKKAILAKTADFTVLIKNTVIFTRFDIMRRNIAEHVNSTYLRGCSYDEDKNPRCPIFRLGDMVKNAYKGSDQSYSTIAVKGGVIGININWDCNLDRSVDHCNPTYSFSRLDDPDAKIAKGWNFRYAHYKNYTSRTLFKAYGIKFVLNVQAKGGKFNVVPLILNISSGLALLGIAIVLCDFVVLYVLKSRTYYQNQKYQMVEAADQEFEELFSQKKDKDFTVDYN
ncbi:P2X purinoceptor 4 [Nymphon striatum]|nr:P2X purinoceptor 4 [Nymphon striatum]